MINPIKELAEKKMQEYEDDVIKASFDTVNVPINRETIWAYNAGFVHGIESGRKGGIDRMIIEVIVMNIVMKYDPKLGEKK